MALQQAYTRFKQVARFSLLGLGAVATVRYYQMRQKALSLPDSFVLDFDLEGMEIAEVSDSLSLPGPLGGASRKLELRQVTEALDKASQDKRIKGILATLGDGLVFEGVAHAQELRQAFHRFREQAAGRALVIAYTDSFGGGGAAGTLPYYVATACDKVYMQPSGLLSATGLAVSTPFVKSLLDKWRIRTQVVKREEYKNFLNSVTETGYTPAHKKATEELLQGFMGQITAGIAADRKLTEAEVKAAMDICPLTAPQAVERKLLDAAKYRDEVVTEAVGSSSQRLPKVPLSKYMRILKHHQRRKQSWAQLLSPAEDPSAAHSSTGGDKLPDPAPSAGKKPAVALICASGSIVQGLGAPQRPGGGSQIAGKPLCQALEKAGLDASVKAVVLRVDSGGGSAVASDGIAREVERLVADKGKPVVVSMGNVAGSGGYYIAAPATAIVAQPGTITGSIGVINGKFIIDTLLKDQGIKFESISTTRNATASFPFNEYNAEQLKQVNQITDWIYDSFIAVVAKGRKLSTAQVRELAKGRIWTGEAALEHQLIDKLGGLPEAIRLAKQHAGLPLEDEEAVELKEISQKPPFVQQLLEQLSGGMQLSALQALAAFLGLPSDARWLGQTQKELSQLQPEGGLQMQCELDTSNVR